MRELLQDLVCPAECSAAMLELQAGLHGGHGQGPTPKHSHSPFKDYRCVITNTDVNRENDINYSSATMFEGGSRFLGQM